MANIKYRYNFSDRGKERVYQSETPHSASTHVLSQYKPSKEDSPTAGHKDYSYNKKTGNVTFSHDREESGVKVSGHKTIPATKEHEEELKNASNKIELEKTKASKMSRAFQHYSASEDKKTAKEESEVHRVPRPSMLSGEVKNISDKVVRVRPRQQESMSLSVDQVCDDIMNKTRASKDTGKNQTSYQSEYELGAGKKRASTLTIKRKPSISPYLPGKHEKAKFSVYDPKEQKLTVETFKGENDTKPKLKTIDTTAANERKLKYASISNQCDDILCKYAGTGRYSGSGTNDPVVTKREGYTVRERPLPGQTKESIKAGHIAEQKKESVKKLEPEEKEKSKIRDEGYKLGQKNPASQYAPPAPPEKKYSGGWRDYFRRSEGNMDLKKSIDELVDRSLFKGKFADPKTGKPLEGYALHSKEYSEEGDKKRFPKHVLNASPSKADEYGTKEIDKYQPNKVRDIHSASRAMKQEQYRTKKEGGVYVTEENDPRVFRKETPAETHSSDISSDIATDKAIARHSKKSLGEQIDDLLVKCNSHVISGETEEGLKKKKKQAPKVDGHTLGKNPSAKTEDLEMVKVDVEGAFKSITIQHKNTSTTEHGDGESESYTYNPKKQTISSKRTPSYYDDKRTAKRTKPISATKNNEMSLKYASRNESDLIKSIDVLLEKAQLPGLNKPAVKQTAKVKTAEDTMATEKPKNLIRSVVDELMQKSLGDIVNRGANIRRGQSYKNDPDAGIEKEKEKKMDAEEKKTEKSMDDLTTEKYIAKSVHLVKDLVKSEEKPIEFFHIPDETYKSQKTILGKWKSGNIFSTGGNRILNTAKDMASEGYTSLKKEDNDVARGEVAGRKKMDREDVKAENKKARQEYSGGDEGAE